MQMIYNTGLSAAGVQIAIVGLVTASKPSHSQIMRRNVRAMDRLSEPIVACIQSAQRI